MGKGIRLGLLYHGFQLLILPLYFTMVSAIPSLGGEEWGYGMFILPATAGLTQLLYMVPGILYFRKSEPDVAKGIALVAAETFLLSATCFGLIWSGKR